MGVAAAGGSGCGVAGAAATGTGVGFGVGSTVGLAVGSALGDGVRSAVALGVGVERISPPGTPAYMVGLGLGTTTPAGCCMNTAPRMSASSNAPPTAAMSHGGTERRLRSAVVAGAGRVAGAAAAAAGGDTRRTGWVASFGRSATAARLAAGAFAGEASVERVTSRAAAVSAPAALAAALSASRRRCAFVVAFRCLRDFFGTLSDKHPAYQRGSMAPMRFGLQVNQFTWPGGPAAIGPTLARVARSADEAGFDSIWVMDHFFQIRGLGPPEAPMLEGQTALGFLAAHTERARLGLMVGGIHYRAPGLWIKAATTLDVLSGGRAWFGIGAAWNVHESKALGFAFPPLRERFELLEDALEMAHAMWSGGSGTGERFDGRRTTATHLINSPQSISRPRVPILVGGGGERKTLRLVAQYADACNIFGRSPSFVRDKLAVLREHCERLGRPYEEIEKTVLTSVDPDVESSAATVERFGELGEAGAEHVIFSIRGVADTSRIERVSSEVLSQLR